MPPPFPPRFDPDFRIKLTSAILHLTTGYTRQVKVRAVPVTNSQTTDPNVPIRAELQAFVADLNTRGSTSIRYSASNHYANMIALHDELGDRLQENQSDAAAPHLNVDLDLPLALIHRVDPSNPWRWIKIGGAADGMTSNVYRVEVAPAVYQALVIEFV
jgi:hypothetical protein